MGYLRLRSLATAIAASWIGAVTVVSATPMPASSSAVEARAASSYWYANIDHTSDNIRGYAPDLDDDYAYPVYKAVKAGDGPGIQAAINAGTGSEKRHGQWLASQPRVCNSACV